MTEKKAELQRGLEARHIELIALGGDDWRGVVYGGGQYLEMGWAFRAAGVHYRWPVRLFHYALNGRNAVP